ncbi:MAG: T9SS type A sorting domain-containing protein [Chitinophagales bacterium]
MKNLIVFILFCTCFNAVNTKAQTNNQWQHLSGSHKVNSIAHDGNIVWFSTDDYGVGKYDRTRNYTSYFNTENSNLSSNKTQQLYMDANGYLWAQSAYKWSVFNGQFWTVFDESNSLLKSEMNAYDLATSKDGTVWFASDKELLKLKNGKWSSIAFSEQQQSGFSHQIATDNDGNLWMSGSTYLSKFDGNNWETFANSEEDVLMYGWVSDLKTDSQNNVWMSLSGYYPVDLHIGGLTKFDGEQWTVYSALETGASVNSYFLTIDQKDKIWTTSNATSIVSFDGQGFETYSTMIAQMSLNPSAVAIDAQNEVWIGTNRGMERLKDGKFEQVNIVFPERWLLSRLATKHHFKADNIWFRNMEGLVMFDGTGWTFKGFENDLELFKDGIGTIVPTSDGNLWVISYDKIYKCDGTNCIEQAPFPIEAQHGRINDGMEDREGNIWFVVDRRQRLIRYDGVEWKDFTETMSQLYIQNGTSIYGITADLDNDIWISTSKGKLHEWKNEKWSTFDLRIPQGFSHQPIHDIAVDKNNQIWVAHQSKLKLFDGEKVVKTFTSTDFDIYETNFWNLNIDTRNNDLWVGTSRAGVLHFNGSDWEHFDSQNSPLTYNAIDYILIDPTGHNWIVPQHGGFDIFRAEGVVPLMSVTDPEEDEEDHPDYEFGGNTNIPNPFTGYTRIPIELSEAGWAKITIFDSRGQIVEKFEQNQLFAGTNYFNIDGTNFKPSLYYYTIETKEGKTTGKMLKQ